MNNLERFRRALNWEPVDRIQTYDLIDCEPLLVAYGGYSRELEVPESELLQINARAWKRIGLDVTRYIHNPAAHWMGGKVDNWMRFFGVNPAQWKISQAGGTAWISERPFRTLRELERHMPQMPLYEEVRDWYAPLIREIQGTLADDDIVFIGEVEGPITDAYTYVDMELFCAAIHQAPELVSHIMDCCGMFSAHVARVYAEVGQAPLVFMGEDIAGTAGPIFRPDWIRREGLPRWRWIAEPLAARGMKFLYHSDGRYGSVLPIIFDELGADGLNPIERNGCNDIFAIRAAYPHKLLFGNVCCAQTLPYGSVGDVEDETLELIERLGPEGGVFIGSSSEVHDLVPLENTRTMYRTVHQYGHYPIDVERIRARRAALGKSGALRLRTAVTT